MFLEEGYEKNKQIYFLENLLIKLKNDELSIESTKDLTEFYLKSEFKKNEPPEENYMKYLSLGWYIYEVLKEDQR